MIRFSENDVFLVTGANSGIGKAISARVIEYGGSVVAVARDADKLEAAKLSMLHPEKYFSESFDLTENIDNIPAWLGSIVAKYGKLKGLVYSAGIQETMPLAVSKYEKAKTLFDINYFAFISLVKGFSKRANNTGLNSSIVCISSFVSHFGLPATVNYSASKGALNSAVKVLASELARDNIRVNSVLPGHIMTDLLLKDSNINNDAFFDALKQKYPLGLGEPDDVAFLVCFLLSDKSKWITGTEMIVDGGASIHF